MLAIVNSIVVFLISPLNLIAVLLFLCLVFFALNFEVLGKMALSLAILLFMVIGFTPLAEYLLRDLEDRVKAEQFNPDEIAGAVVLGGAVGLSEIARIRDTYTLSESSERVVKAIELRKRYPDMTIVLAAGGSLSPHGMGEGAMLRRMLADLQFQEDDFIIEDKAVNTFENATNMSALGLDLNRPWLLVTSAYHMQRAVATFEAQGMQVIPHPVDYQAPTPQLWRTRFDVTERFIWMRQTIKEWVGLWSYRALGRI